MSADEVIARVPAYVVRGLLSGEAMVNNDPDSTDMQAVRVLQQASYVKRGRGEQAVLTAAPQMLRHIADYLSEFARDSGGVLGCYDRFGFSRAAAGDVERRLNEAAASA